MKPKNAIEIDAKEKADKEGYETMSEISFTDDTLEQQRFADQHQLDAGILKELTDMKLKLEECFKLIGKLQKELKDEKTKREDLEKGLKNVGNRLVTTEKNVSQLGTKETIVQDAVNAVRAVQSGVNSNNPQPTSTLNF